MDKVLEDIGLTKNETKVYLALLELGPSLASKIAEKTNFNRTHVYDILKSLIEKGLVSFIMLGKKKHFKAESPENLLSLLREKESNLKDILPKLLAMPKAKESRLDAVIYKGKKGLKAITEGILKEKQNLVIGAGKHELITFPFYFKHYIKKRIKKKIKFKVIFNQEAKFRYKEFKRLPFTEARLMPYGLNSPLAVNIYGDKVALILWAKEDVLGIVIENRKIAEGFKNYFNLLWKIMNH